MLDNLQRDIDAPIKSKETRELEVDLEFNLSKFPFKELFGDDAKPYGGVNMSKREQEQLFQIVKDLYRLYYGEDFINS